MSSTVATIALAVSAVMRRSAAANRSLIGARTVNRGDSYAASVSDKSNAAIRCATRCDSLAATRSPSRRTNAFASAI